MASHSTNVDLKASDTTSDGGSSTSSNEECEMASDKMEAAEVTASSSAKQADDSIPGTSSGFSGENTISGIDKILLDHRNNIMFELRRLQLGDRPVTGQGNKEAIENFFSRSQNGELPPSSESTHRPHSVTVEVSALVNRRPVSSLLQSDRFRRSLESTLHRALSGVQLPQQASSRTTTGTGENDPSRADVIRQPPTLESSNNEIPSNQSRISEVRQHFGHQSNAVSNHQNRAQSSVLGSREVELRSQEVYGNNLNQSSHRPISVQEVLAEAQRDEMIAEISELLQRELVTSSLEGRFRNNLERLMANRLSDTQTDGQRVQEFIRGLPSRRPARNDFSHLGLNAGNFGDDLDQISVISATATVAAHHGQLDSGLSREMAAIKAQLSEMRNMIQISLDTQLDIQRAIRQEVAAAINNLISEGKESIGLSSEAALSFLAPAATPCTSGNCAICLDVAVDTVLYQCGHMCVCYTCGMRLKSRGAHCPLCRAPIRDIIRTYR